MLIIPPSITIIQSDDENVNINANARKNHLIQGYMISELTEGPNKYRVTINCNHSLFIECMKFLIGIVPERFLILIGEYSKLEQLDGDYRTDDMLNIIDQNETFLKDCTNIEMAFDYLDAETAFQVYISDCKFFEVFTDNLDFLKTFNDKFNINEVNDLAILTEFPRTMTSQMSSDVKKEIQNITNTLYTL